MRRAGMFTLPVALLLAACGLIPGGSGPDLTGDWLLVGGTDQGKPIPIVEGVAPTLRIDGSTIRGHAACNIYGGTIKIDRGSVQISALSMTEMACDEPRMASEAAYMAALPRATTAVQSGDSLVLSGPQLDLRFALIPAVSDAELAGPTWVLTSLIDGEVTSSARGPEANLHVAADGTISDVSANQTP